MNNALFAHVVRDHLNSRHEHNSRLIVIINNNEADDNKRTYVGQVPTYCAAVHLTFGLMS